MKKISQPQQSLHLLFFFMALLMTACQQPENPDPDPDPDPVYVGTMYDTTFTAYQGVEKIFADMGSSVDDYPEYQMVFKIIKAMKTVFHATAITYHTVDPKGNAVVASGVIYYPKDTEIKGVVEVTPITRGKTECATQRVIAGEAIPVISQYAVMVPDLIGAGSTADMPQAFLLKDNTARVSADFRKAAEEFFQTSYQLTIPDSSYLFGYSMGASGSLALARLYQEHPEYGVKVKGLTIGGGAYDLNVALDEFVKKNKAALCVIPGLFTAMDEYYDLKLDYTQLFIGELLKNRIEYCSGDYTPLMLTKILGTDLRAYMHADFFTEEKNAEILKLREAFEKQSELENWQPEMSIRMYHATSDDYVPIACSDSLYSVLSSTGRVLYSYVNGGHHPVCMQVFKDFTLDLMMQ